MKNKELLNICYKFFNRFITVDKMIEMLDNMDKKDISVDELEKLNDFIRNVKEIIKKTLSDEDEYVISQRKKIKESIKQFEQMTKKSESISAIFNHLKEDYQKEIDSYEIWFNVVDYINKNEYFNTCFNNLSDYELLEFIGQNIQAPFPPKLSQKQFNKLVKVGIEKDERELLWRLAFNYGDKGINLDAIVNYYIKKKDAGYLLELISAVGEYLDIDSIIDKINDKEIIEDLINEKKILCSYISKEQFNKLNIKLDM